MLPSAIFEKIKELLVRVVKDSDFINQLQTSSAEDAQAILKEAGYRFSREHFESAAMKILDLKEKDQFHELSEEELVGAVGGFLYGRKPPFWIQPLYGVIIDPPDSDRYPHPYPKPRPRPTPVPWEPPIVIQPMYGVIIDPFPDPIPGPQPMYGVVVSDDI